MILQHMVYVQCQFDSCVAVRVFLATEENRMCRKGRHTEHEAWGAVDMKAHVGLDTKTGTHSES